MTRSRRGTQFDNNPIKYSPALDPVNTIILARSRVGLYLIGSQLSIPCNTEHNTSTKTAQMG